MRTKHIISILVFAVVCQVQATQIRNIVDIQGERGNALQGLGIVVGLNGTGDSTLPSAQMMSSYIQRNDGISYLPNDLKSGNIAQVMVTAELGPWNRVGQRIDIDVSAINDCKSLQGGVLIMTELKGADGEVYATTRAVSISTSSWTVEGNTGSRAAKNHPTVGRISGGAYVEREEIGDFVDVIGGQRYVTLLLRYSDFTTAERISEAIEKTYKQSVFVEDAGTIRVRIPDDIAKNKEVRFLDAITSADVKVNTPAVVVINERTGTIVVGGTVSITETAIAQGGLVVKIKEQPTVSQANPFADGGSTEVIDNTTLDIIEEGGALIPVPHVVTVEELAKALNAIGATPRDLIAIFNALKVAGALQARIEMM